MFTKVCLLSVLLAASVQCQGGYGDGYGEGSMAKILNAAVISNQHVSFKDVPSRTNAQPTYVYIDSAVSPINLIFRSSSSPVNIEQQHNPGTGSVRESSSEDAPHRVLHTVTKPIIQLVREIIRPRRIVQQQIMPVQEEIKTIISRAKGGAQKGAGSFVDNDAQVQSAFAALGDDEGGVGSGDGSFGNVDMGDDEGAFGGGGDSSAGGASRGASKGARAGNRRPYQGGKNQADAGRYGSQGGTTSTQTSFAGLGAEEERVGSGDGAIGNADMANDFGGSTAGGMGASQGASKGGANAGRALGSKSRGAAAGYGSQGGTTTNVQASFAGLGGEKAAVGSGDGGFGNADMDNDFGAFGGGDSSAGGMGAPRGGNANRSQGGKTQGGTVGYGSQEMNQLMNQVMNQGMIQGMSQGMSQGMIQEVNQEVNQGMIQGMNQGMSQGMSQGMIQEVNQEVNQGMNQGMSQGMNQGVAGQ